MGARPFITQMMNYCALFYDVVDDFVAPGASSGGNICASLESASTRRTAAGWGIERSGGSGSARLSGAGCLGAAMQTIERLLSEQPEGKSHYLIRQHQPGDMGWVVQQHGELYARRYGWDEQFEALLVEITAKFIQNFDPKRDRCWIAEMDGENVGFVFLVKKSKTAAQLRLLVVDSRARGLGIGKRLVSECARFAPINVRPPRLLHTTEALPKVQQLAQYPAVWPAGKQDWRRPYLLWHGPSTCIRLSHRWTDDRVAAPIIL